MAADAFKVQEYLTWSVSPQTLDVDIRISLLVLQFMLITLQPNVSHWWYVLASTFKMTFEYFLGETWGVYGYKIGSEPSIVPAMGQRTLENDLLPPPPSLSVHCQEH